MLRSLFINNIAIISKLDIEFHEGMTSVTGETGAGKSIVIDALALGLGSRADQSLIKHGCDNAEVIIEFDISNNLPAQTWINRHELGLDEPHCILKRRLYSNKPSKSFINDRPVSATLLAEFGQNLVNICGQQEHLNLINPAARLAIIDLHANINDEIKALKSVYKNLKQIDSQIAELEKAQGDNESNNDLLAFLVDELSQGNFSVADYRELDENQKRLSHNGEIISSINTSIEALQSATQNNVSDLLNQVSKSLTAASRYEPKLKNTLKTLESANVACEEATNELVALSGQLDLDPGQLQELELRLSSYHQMARKHRCEPTQLEEKLESLQGRLELLENSDIQLKTLHDKQLKLTGDYNKIAKNISKLRCDSATKLSKSITKQLQQLNLEGSACQIECNTDKTVISPNGQDSARILVSTNPGQPPGPIEKIASGGELSRISMAIALESSMQAGNAVLIFDEVDAGISGKTADVVGNKLKQLSEKNQTICITHLPQVASKANYQLRVSKNANQKSQVKLDYLDTEDRVIELARFLSGKNITDESLANARAMLNES